MSNQNVISRSFKRRLIIGTTLVAMFIVAFVLVQPVMASEATPETYNISSLSVEDAYNMIKHNDITNLVVLDVRYICEYSMGCLYNAVSIPYDELEVRICELEANEDDQIIVYCKSGYTSQMACEFLVSHGFSNVYNMEGGILAWIDADYPVRTTYHYATVDVVDEEILLEVEPLLLYQTCTEPCTQCQTCPSYDQPSNIQYEVLEQDDNHVIYLVTYEVSDVEYEFTVTNTLLWTYHEATDEVDRVANLQSTEITGPESCIQYYALSYSVEHIEYNFTSFTYLTLSGSETYDSAFTIMNYDPIDKSEVISYEFVEFNTSVTLSEQYAILGKVAKEIGKDYGKSSDAELAQFAPRYRTIEDEAKYLSQLIRNQVSDYDKEILVVSAILMDQDWLLCLG